MLAKLIDFLLCRFTSFITGVRPQKNVEQQSADKHRLYFANHNSHVILFYCGSLCLIKCAKTLARLPVRIIGQKGRFVVSWRTTCSICC